MLKPKTAEEWRRMFKHDVLFQLMLATAQRKGEVAGVR
jgi:hypothetical protein